MATGRGRGMVVRMMMITLMAAAAAPAMSDEPQKIRKVTVVFKNSCTKPLWPMPLNRELAPGAQQSYSAVNDATDTVTALMFWAKVGCNSAATNCDSGECEYQHFTNNNTIKDTCPFQVPDSTPATMVTFKMSFGFVNMELAATAGFNLPISVYNSNSVSSSSRILSCDLLLADCPSKNVVLKGQRIVGCAYGPDNAGFNKLVGSKCPMSRNIPLVEGGVYTINFCPK